RSNIRTPWFSATTPCIRVLRLWRAAKLRSNELAPTFASKDAFDPTVHTLTQLQENPMSASSATTFNTMPSASSTKDSGVPTIAKVAELTGRILLASLFLVSGLGKIGAYAGTAAYMASLGVPGALLPLVIALEIFGGLAIVLGWKTRITASLLAGFTLVTAFVFHNNFGDQIQAIMFLKNVSIAGAFLLLVATGAGPLS